MACAQKNGTMLLSEHGREAERERKRKELR